MKIIDLISSLLIGVFLGWLIAFILLIIIIATAFEKWVMRKNVKFGDFFSGLKDKDLGVKIIFTLSYIWMAILPVLLIAVLVNIT